MIRPDSLAEWISDRQAEAGDLSAYACAVVPGKGRIISQLDLSDDSESIAQSIFSAVINNCEGMGKKSVKVETYYKGEPNNFNAATLRIQEIFDEFSIEAPILNPSAQIGGMGASEVKSAAFLLTKSIEILHKTTLDANKRATDAQNQTVQMMREIANLQAELARREDSGSEVIQALQALAPIATVAAQKMLLGGSSAKQIEGPAEEEAVEPDPKETAKEIMQLLESAPAVKEALLVILNGDASSVQGSKE